MAKSNSKAAVVGLFIVLIASCGVLYWMFYWEQTQLEDGALFMMVFTDPSSYELSESDRISIDLAIADAANRVKQQLMPAADPDTEDANADETDAADSGDAAETDTAATQEDPNAWKWEVFTPRGKELLQKELKDITVNARLILTPEQEQRLNDAWANFESYKDQPETEATLNKVFFLEAAN